MVCLLRQLDGVDALAAAPVDWPEARVDVDLAAVSDERGLDAGGPDVGELSLRELQLAHSGHAADGPGGGVALAADGGFDLVLRVLHAVVSVWWWLAPPYAA